MLPVVERFDLLAATAFLMVLAVLTAVVLPAIYSQKKARRDAALAVLDRILPGRGARERALADVAKRAIDEYLERDKGNPMTDK
jgi:hypothetical protein